MGSDEGSEWDPKSDIKYATPFNKGFGYKSRRVIDGLRKVTESVVA